ncbi:MAG: phosphotransferase [Candidatus Acidiferrales bacterium]
MTAPTRFETHPYRLIVTRYGGSEVLLGSSPPSLPSLDLPCGARPAEALICGIERKYRLETYCLWVNHDTVPGGDSVSGDYAVMEILEPNVPAPTGMCWALASDAASRVGGADGAAIRGFIEGLERYSAAPENAPFAQPAWIQKLLSWAGAHLEPCGLRLTGGFWQLNAGPTFSLIRLQTNRAPVWFKATGEPNARELPVSLTVARLLPEFVPPILGVHPSWNGWLSSHVPGRLLCELENHSAWENVARTLARLQIASIEKGSELRESKVRDLGTGRLAELVDPFIECMSGLMRVEEEPSAAPLTPLELGSLRDQLGEACWRLEGLGMPDSLGRFDLNPGNIVVSRDGVVFLDWAETYWGHPFLSFAYLVEHFRRHSPGVTFESRLKSAYAEPWEEICAKESVSSCLAMAPLIAAFAYTVESRNWREPEIFCDSQAAAYLRSMTRRMHREAKLLEEARLTCLS